ncbi:ABC transporter substrate-binding protein [Streptomyces abyssomicinicus]|uniref:ABC transporter substrate-binding protein n=1 Tax=Streptomyces abyssomicinicus TaxID=574929 RepID=UPI001250023C|nr:ABC transporter substrate-binding protein [Streptomyces abyssomicinicus]
MALLALLLTATTSGCAGALDTPRSRGNVLTYGIDQQPDCLDPQVSPLDVTALVDRNLFDSLVEMAPDGHFRPWLAERWSVSADGRTYTFRVRDGVTFHDGTPFTAHAVKATLDHAVDPRTKSQYAASLISSYRSSRVVDASTVVVRLSRPDSAFLQALSTAYLGIQSPTSLRENTGNLCTEPVGSGPFRLTGWARNRSLEMERNPDYRWAPPGARHSGPAHLDGLVVQFITEGTARFGALATGQVDAIGNVPPAKIGALKASGQLRHLRAESPGVPNTVFLNTRSGPLADERVRKALLRSVDLDQLVDTLYFGRYSRAWGALTPTTPYYSASVEGRAPYDPDEAARLLDAAGWTGRDSRGIRVKDGRPLALRWPYIQEVHGKMSALAQGMQAQAKQVGIDLRWTSVDAGAFIQKTDSGRGLEMFSASFVRAEPDILRYWFGSRMTIANGGGNVFHLDDPVLDRALADGAAASDPQARAAAYARAQQRLVDRALALPTYVPVSLVGTSDRVHGLRFEPNAYPLFYDVRLGDPR